MRMEQMTADTVLLKLQNVTKTRNGWKVLNHVTAEVRENRIIGVIGDNGIGKSTLLKTDGRAAEAGRRPGLSTERRPSPIFFQEATFTTG